MASLGRRPIPPTHPLAQEQISFVPKQTSSASSSSVGPNEAPSDPMLSAMNGMEDWLRQEAEKYGATAPASPKASPSKAPTTPNKSEPT